MSSSSPLQIGNLQIDFAKRQLSISRIAVADAADDDDDNDNDNKKSRRQPCRILLMHIGCAIDQSVQMKDYVLEDTFLSLKADDGVELRIKFFASDENVYEKYEITWQSTEKYHFMKDTVTTDTDGGLWYGGPEVAQQKWPLARNTHQFSPYLPLDILKDGAKTPSGMERYWLCSNKFALFVPDSVPLWTEHNDGRLSLQAQISDSPYAGFYDRCVAPTLCYTIYAANRRCTLREFHIAVHGGLYEPCRDIPDEALIRKPIWTTWARYKEKITQKDFDKVKFPDVKAMCKKLRQWNIRLTLWIHPFINLNSDNGRNPALRQLFVKDISGEPGIVNWWQGQAYSIDFTNPEAASWFRAQLEGIKKLGVFSFKFDAGEVTYLPANVRLHTGTALSDFTEAYVRTAALFGNAVEVRVFRRTQPLAIFYRTIDRFSTWSNIGLNTLIPIALNFGLHGYYYNLPDMIGGNGYGGAMCSKELFIRWMQANQFLLSMQFSYSPWEFDDEVCDVFHRIIKKREEMLDFLIEACRKSCENAEPVIRPLWWLSEEPVSLYSGDQFVIDDTIIVAPVLVEGATSRPVFLPDSTWEYELTHQHYTGPCQIIVEAPLLHHSPPYFVRIG